MQRAINDSYYDMNNRGLITLILSFIHYFLCDLPQFIKLKFEIGENSDVNLALF